MFVSKSDPDELGDIRRSPGPAQGALWERALSQTFTWHMWHTMPPRDWAASDDLHSLWHISQQCEYRTSSMPSKQCVTPRHTHTALRRADREQKPPSSASGLSRKERSTSLDSHFSLLGPWHFSYIDFGSLGDNGPERVGIGSYSFIISKSCGTQSYIRVGVYSDMTDQGDKRKETELMIWVRGARGSMGWGHMLQT